MTSLPVKEGEVTVIGTMNNAGTQLMTISDMSDGRGRADGRRDRRCRTSRSGQKASLTIDAYPNRKFDGVVTEVGSSPISKTTRTSRR